MAAKKAATDKMSVTFNLTAKIRHALRKPLNSFYNKLRQAIE